MKGFRCTWMAHSHQHSKAYTYCAPQRLGDVSLLQELALKKAFAEMEWRSVLLGRFRRSPFGHLHLDFFVGLLATYQ